MARLPAACLMAWAALGAARTAHAGGVGAEVSAGATEATAESPRTAYLANLVNGTVDLAETFSLRLDAAFTHLTAEGGPSGGDIFRFALYGDWYPTPHLAFGTQGNYSPRSETRAWTQVYFMDAARDRVDRADALLVSDTSSYGFGLDAEYDTAGESALETVVGLGADVLVYETGQRIAKAQTADGVEVTPFRIAEYCRPNPCPPELEAVLAGTGSGAIDQLKLSATLIETLFQDTDLGVRGAYYLYRSEEGAGFFSLASFGRGAPAGEVVVAPLRFTVRPSVVQRFGPFQVGLWSEYGQYVPGQGYHVIVGLKLQHRFTRSWKAWLGGTGQHDVVGSGGTMLTTSASLGARLTF
jgi:hypothetical protein